MDYADCIESLDTIGNLAEEVADGRGINSEVSLLKEIE